MSSIRLLALLGAASLITACSTVSSGTPVLPTGVVGSSTTASGGTPMSRPASARPREIKLAGQDPCALTPPSDWAKFEIEKSGRPEVSPSSKEPKCVYTGQLGGLGLTVNSKEGIEVWDERARAVQIEDAPPILGFPTIRVDQKSPPGTCSAVVDVADGQTLDIMVIALSEAAARKCEIAYEFAESAMKVLVGS
ncbi:DUF3558 domain-containing protein [Actinokineospora sp.]|uniref:DUF3558 domain-containing protein n=1 Tax=Actinokineospora sp. TaxID=1872133 RepID=UPI0040379270